MRVNAYLSFKGDCEAAFKFYEQSLGGKLGAIFRYEGTPFADTAPADWRIKVMHGTLTIGDQVFMGADVVPEHYEAPKGFSLSVHIKGAQEAERVFSDLSQNGRVLLPLEKTFWAERFGMVVDRFGIPWLINAEAGDEANVSGEPAEFHA
jgi:PhnB protein